MTAQSSIGFFDAQFRRQLAASELQLNPFEQQALPHLRGRVLDYGCGLGNLAIAAARQGCSVLALDGSRAAIAHLKEVARRASLAIEPAEEDLRSYELREDFDAVVSIGLLMFFDCPTAERKLRELQAHLRPGGVAVINVLEEGTTYLDMFDDRGHCLFARDRMAQYFEGWDILSLAHQDFPAPGGHIKSFATVIATKRQGTAAGDGPVM